MTTNRRNERALALTGGDRPAVSRPVLIAGADRSGTTLLYALLAAHPNISMFRRSNMFRYFNGHYGDLSDPANLDRCLGEMLRYRRLRALEPDEEAIRRAFAEGPATYGRLFDLLHAQHAQRVGRSRWGDKSLHTELYADAVFAEFPEARVIQMMRDPRDRYASVRRRHPESSANLGRGVGRWIDSTRAGLRNVVAHPDRYLIVRYEDLVHDPETKVREICRFIDEPYEPRMLTMEETPEHRDRSNSSFGDIAPGTISTKAVGRYPDVLSPTEVRLIQSLAAREMTRVGYEAVPVPLAGWRRLRYGVWDLPKAAGRVVAWRALARVTRWRGESVPGSRLAPTTEDQ